MLFDSHAHLDDSRYEENRGDIIGAAEAEGVKYILNPGADLASSIKAVNISEKYDGVYAAVGVHPHDVKDMDDSTIELLKSLTTRKKVVAIGEIGLDYYYNHSPQKDQIKWFRRQLELAKSLKLPVIIHDRDAHQDTFDILKEYKAGDWGCVMHCFSGSVELAKEYVKLGVLISFAGPLTFKNAKKTHQVAKEIPLRWLMVETDSPYLTPEPLRGKRNQPLNVKHVAEALARIKGLPLEEIAEKTTKNAKDLLSIE
ncbi:TatD family hydrolase [Alkaliphilus serpentinus]|uniref:TatD family deoxyribonuclease n=1 Tax=Alkaliphilus serpentinus TaxID=1482731 RepID=A0A833M8W5_9FIRM|nr:TatD family hydrolase [Alkaliphilus serpentinus]KAB3531821.1 TatD family deoxyribonuclease [Alkaliphilus serpentinus]